MDRQIFLLDACLEHLVAYCCLANKEDASRLDGSGWRRWSVPVSQLLWNGLYQECALPEFAKFVQQQIAFFQRERRPFTWWLADRTLRLQVDGVLTSVGFRPCGSMLALGAILDELPCFGYDDRVQKISLDSPYILSYLSLIQQAFYPNAPTMREQFYQIFTDVQDAFEHYVACDKNGIVAGGATLTFTRYNGKLIAGLWNAAVAAGHRRRGLGTALAMARLQAAREREVDCVVSLLDANRLAEGYCRRLGLVPLQELPIYLYGTSNRERP